MQLTADAIVLAVRAHGEHGAVVRLLTPGDGVLPGYVRGGRSRALRPVLIPGNLVRAEFRARTETQLAALTVELLASRAGLLGEPLLAGAIDWATALTAVAAPEGQPYPAIHAGLDGLLTAIEAAPSAAGWAAALARYEALLLAQLGFGGQVSVIDPGADLPRVLESLRCTGRQLERDVLQGRRAEVLAARDRLMQRLKAIF